MRAFVRGFFMGFGMAGMTLAVLVVIAAPAVFAVPLVFEGASPYLAVPAATGAMVWAVACLAAIGQWLNRPES
jgi:hypothetical protein